jgi:hypothetical protein
VSLADVLAAIAIVVSIATAYATLYFQYFQRRRVAVALGDHLYLSYGPADGSGGYEDLGAVLSVSLINAGATDALVTVMSITAKHTDGDPAIDFRWRAFNESADAGTPGKSSSPTWNFKGWVTPLAATSRQVVTEWIYFGSGGPLPAGLKTGSYRFQLTVTEIRPRGGRIRDTTTDDADRRQLAVWDGQFTIEEWAFAYLRDNCVASEGYAPDTCPVALSRRPSGVGTATTELSVSA